MPWKWRGESRGESRGRAGWWNFAGGSNGTRFLRTVARYSIYWWTINGSPRGPSRRDPRSPSNATLFQADCNNIFQRTKDAHNTAKFKSRVQGRGALADFFSPNKTIATRGVAARRTSPIFLQPSFSSSQHAFPNLRWSSLYSSPREKHRILQTRRTTT